MKPVQLSDVVDKTAFRGAGHGKQRSYVTVTGESSRSRPSHASTVSFNKANQPNTRRPFEPVIIGNHRPCKTQLMCIVWVENQGSENKLRFDRNCHIFFRFIYVTPVKYRRVVWYKEGFMFFRYIFQSYQLKLCSQSSSLRNPEKSASIECQQIFFLTGCIRKNGFYEFFSGIISSIMYIVRT